MPKPAADARQTTSVSSRGVSRPIRVPGTFPTYATAVKHLNGHVNVERRRPALLDPDVFKLDRTWALVEALGNPQHGVKTVHIAGSKGKGSTAEMLAACLRGCGYTVGLFTSPHLVDVRERIRINTPPVSRPAFTALMGRVAEAAGSIEHDHGPATYFELLTAMGLCHFADMAVDLAVIECGLGGRMDSTNVIEPEVAAITAIHLEHTAILGDTLAQIAGEKAGIFKRGVAAITTPQPEEVIAVFEDHAARVGAPLRVLGREIDYNFRFEASPELGPHVRVCVNTPSSSFDHLPVPLKGEHQAGNCGLVLAVLDELRERGFQIPDLSVAQGLARTPDDARMEIVGRVPRTVIDGAHTVESVGALVRAVGAHVRYDSMVVIFGCAADKNVDGMLAQIARGADKIIFTRAKTNPRSADPEDLRQRFSRLSVKMSQTAPDLGSALDLATRAVGRDDLVCITGSFYLVGEAKRRLAGRGGSRGS